MERELRKVYSFAARELSERAHVADFILFCGDPRSLHWCEFLGRFKLSLLIIRLRRRVSRNKCKVTLRDQRGGVRVAAGDTEDFSKALSDFRPSLCGWKLAGKFLLVRWTILVLHISLGALKLMRTCSVGV